MTLRAWVFLLDDQLTFRFAIALNLALKLVESFYHLCRHPCELLFEIFDKWVDICFSGQLLSLLGGGAWRFDLHSSSCSFLVASLFLQLGFLASRCCLHIWLNLLAASFPFLGHRAKLVELLSLLIFNFVRALNWTIGDGNCCTCRWGIFIRTNI